MDSRSCGLYITAINADKHIPQDDQCGGLYCETTPFTCSSDYNITFSCTNTTYLDDTGNAQGVTIFVATDYDSNEPLSEDQQDPRYDFIGNGQPVLDRLFYTVINETEPYDLVPVDNQTLDGGVLPPDPDILPSDPGVLPPDPSVLPTCLRGCLCGYSGPYGQYSDDIYSYCDCEGSLAILSIYH